MGEELFKEEENVLRLDLMTVDVQPVNIIKILNCTCSWVKCTVCESYLNKAITLKILLPA